MCHTSPGMDIQVILRKLLIQEVITEATELCDDIVGSGRIRDIVLQVISEANPVFEIPVKHCKPCIMNDSWRCCARIWDSHRGSRCHSQIRFGEYCGKHHSEIETKGYLQFSRYDERRPEINEKGTIISWYDQSPIEVLSIISRHQMVNLKKLIKRTEITP